MFYLKSYSCLDSSWLFEHEEILNDKYLNSKVLHLVEIYNFRIIFPHSSSYEIIMIFFENVLFCEIFPIH
jgi:hypothetical protein